MEAPSGPTWPIPSKGLLTNSLRYEIHPLNDSVDLSKVCSWILTRMQQRTTEFIWNLDEFTLTFSNDRKKLHGEMEMGQETSVCPDEWTVVGILWETSERFPDIVIRYPRVRTKRNADLFIDVRMMKGNFY